MNKDEINRVRKLMGYSLKDLADASCLTEELIARILSRCEPGQDGKNDEPKKKTKSDETADETEDGERTDGIEKDDELPVIEQALLELIRRDAAAGNIVHEEVLPYLADSNWQ